jgi:hypothetical protein
MSCDDRCLLRISETPNSNSTLKNLLYVPRYSGLRDYWLEDGNTRISEEISLTKGEHYYIEAN